VSKESGVCTTCTLYPDSAATEPALSCARAQDAADVRRSHHIAVADAHEGRLAAEGAATGCYRAAKLAARPSPAWPEAAGLGTCV